VLNFLALARVQKVAEKATHAASKQVVATGRWRWLNLHFYVFAS
jgi:hypothetical protein